SQGRGKPGRALGPGRALDEVPERLDLGRKAGPDDALGVDQPSVTDEHDPDRVRSGSRGGPGAHEAHREDKAEEKNSARHCRGNTNSPAVAKRIQETIAGPRVRTSEPPFGDQAAF